MKKLALLGLIAAVGLTGCALTGGGTLNGASFGFTWDNHSGLLRGTYEDKSAGVSVSITSQTQGPANPGQQPGSGCITTSGTYRSQDKNHASGPVYITACDWGEPGAGVDYLSISMSGAISYSNSGFVQNGNLQFRNS